MKTIFYSFGRGWEIGASGIKKLAKQGFILAGNVV